MKSYPENVRQAHPLPKETRDRLSSGMEQFLSKNKNSKLQFSDINVARKRAAYIRRKTLEHLDDFLIEFETKFTRNGGKVLWAVDAEEANQLVLSLMKEHYVKSVVKSKSMVTEEIGLRNVLEKNSIKVLETDLGEFIQQQSKEPPFHPVTPAMHHNSEYISELFKKNINPEVGSSPEELAEAARVHMRNDFFKAGACITGANFLIADTGSVVITENEGNTRLGTAFPELHVVVTGIEKMLPSINDLSLFLPLLSTYGTGQKITSYNTLFSGPAKEKELDGPEKMVVVLVDNGRSDLLSKTPQRESLACIKCGACVTVCPIFHTIGGHGYGRVYGGPIGSVVAPFIGNDRSWEPSYASTLCGRCTDVCPVNINLHDLLLKNRIQHKKEEKEPIRQRLNWTAWKKLMMSRALLELVPANLKQKFYNSYTGEEFPKPGFSKTSFHRQWKDNNGGLKNQKKPK